MAPVQHNLLSVDRIEKRFGSLRVLAGCSLQLNKGDRALLLGCNGAGKSTLLRILSGLVRADKGTRRTPLETKNIGYAGHQILLYEELTVQENLELFADLLGCRRSVTAIVDRWNLSDLTSRKVGELSRGQQSRVSLARATLADPYCLLLDEPTSALDDSACERFLSVLDQQTNLQAVLIASHDLHRLRAFVNRVLVLEGGEIAFDTDTLRVEGVAFDEACERAIASYRELNR